MTTMNPVSIPRRDQQEMLYLGFPHIGKNWCKPWIDAISMLMGASLFLTVADKYKSQEVSDMQRVSFPSTAILSTGMESSYDMTSTTVYRITLEQSSNTVDLGILASQATGASPGESLVLINDVGAFADAGTWPELERHPARSVDRLDVQIRRSIDSYMRSGPPVQVLSDVVGFLHWAQRSLKQVDVSVADDGLLSLGARRPSGEQLFVEIDGNGVLEAALLGEEGIKALDIRQIAELPWILARK